MNPSPLAGRRVLVTRAAHQAGKLSEGLRALGAESIEVPVLEIQPPSTFEALDAALRQLNSYDWIIFTSANTIHALVERAAALGIALTGQAQLKTAAVGGATAKAAKEAGLHVSFFPDAYVAEALVDGLAAEAAGRRILLARAAVARDVIPDALRAAGATVDVVDAYRNLIPEDAAKRLQAALKKGIDAVPFTSSSSVTHLLDAALVAGVPWPFAGVVAISIGPITSQTLRDCGWEPAYEANPSDIPGLIAAVVRALHP